MNSSSHFSIPQRYSELRKKHTWPRVAITVYELEEIEQRQVGYHCAEGGRGLVGPGKWEPQWIVIGHDDLSGDPIFLDVSKSELPVFTAMHGQGSWEAELIAQSTTGFFASLKLVEDVQSGLLTRDSGLAKVAELNRENDVDMEFWAVLMELQR